MEYESYQTIKALHIIFMVSWFAGLFYIVRLFIYHSEAQTKDEAPKKILSDQFEIMEKTIVVDNNDTGNGSYVRIWYLDVYGTLGVLFLRRG